jgi:hypothetical protein
MCIIHNSTIYSAKPFFFAPQAVKPQESEDKTDNENKDEEDKEEEEPPKPDFKPVTEKGAFYEQRYSEIFTLYDISVVMYYMSCTIVM